MKQGFTFAEFRLDPVERRLMRGGEEVELNARYFDALLLMVGEGGRLVSKDRFMDEVWRGIPVTDEALTQCIRFLRRQLGDDASSPRFIQTVPKHGYRFIAEVEGAEHNIGGAVAEVAPVAPEFPLGRFWQVALAGTLGGGAAGLLGGMVYGVAAGVMSPGPGVGAASMLVVLVVVTMLVALAGGAGVSAGIAAGLNAPERFGGRLWQWSMIGGAAGGLLVGAIAKMLGMDAFRLLLGHSPGNITGPAEGLILGAAAGLAAWLADRAPALPGLRRSLAISALLGAGAGLLVALAGGRLMGGSLAVLVASFPDSQLRLGQVGALFGESGFGPVATAVTSALEGLLFTTFVVGGIVAAEKYRGRDTQWN